MGGPSGRRVLGEADFEINLNSGQMGFLDFEWKHVT